MGSQRGKGSRRQFLLQAGLLLLAGQTAGAAPAARQTAAVFGRQLVPTAVKGPRLAALLRPSRCDGCRQCVAACDGLHQGDGGGDAGGRLVLYHRQAGPGGKGAGPFPFLPVFCQQCSHPRCLTVCPAGAIYHHAETGLVLTDRTRCSGCRACIAACPYNARYLDGHGLASHCDFCGQRPVWHDARPRPACAAACPREVMVFGRIGGRENTLSMLLRRHDKEVRVLRPGTGCQPNVFYLP